MSDASTVANIVKCAKRLIPSFSVRTLLCGVTCVCLLCALIIPPVRAVRDWRQRLGCSSKLTGIALALHCYHDIHGRFPPACIVDSSGKPMHSWRVLITPYMGGAQFCDDYDFSQPWNSKHNVALAREYAWLGDMFLCPAASDHTHSGLSYMMISGRDQPRCANNFVPHIITKGGIDSGRVILVAEVSETSGLWTEPIDLSMSEMSFRINDRSKASISSHHPGGAMVLCDNGFVEFVDESVDWETVRSRLLSAP